MTVGYQDNWLQRNRKPSLRKKKPKDDVAVGGTEEPIGTPTKDLEADIKIRVWVDESVGEA